MSLYADYLAEMGDDKIIESPSGWITYRYLNEGRSVYILDVYVVPEERRKGGATSLADLVVEEAKSKGCSELLGTIKPSYKGSTISMKLQLAYGFSLFSALNDAIVLRKDI